MPFSNYCLTTGKIKAPIDHVYPFEDVLLGYDRQMSGRWALWLLIYFSTHSWRYRSRGKVIVSVWEMGQNFVFLIFEVLGSIGVCITLSGINDPSVTTVCNVWSTSRCRYILSQVPVQLLRDCGWRRTFLKYLCYVTCVTSREMCGAWREVKWVSRTRLDPVAVGGNSRWAVLRDNKKGVEMRQ